MTRVLAVDGGQSAIRLRHSDVARPIAVDGVSRLEGDTIGAVVAAVAMGWQQAGAPATDRVVLGLTTAPTDGSSRRRLCSDVAAGVSATEVWLADDAVTGHAGALTLGWGGSVIVGTGVASLAQPREGEARIIGGHGYLLGDEGGAFWIGGAGVRAVLRAREGRGSATELQVPAERHFGDLDDLGDRLHSSDRPVDTIARFAPDVLRIAANGDAVASGILAAAVDELVTLVRATAHYAATAGDPIPVPIALGGRLLEATPLRTRLDEALERQLPEVRARSADDSPLQGAMLLGQKPEPGPYRDLVFTWGATA